MLVTLLENVKALGAEGQSVEVPEGYAVNFLFPQHLAVKEEKKAGEETVEKKKPSAAESAEEKLAAEIDGLEIMIPVKAVKGKPKMPITSTEIRAGLKELGYSIEKKFIKTEPLKNFDSVEVPVEFPSGFEALLRVTIEPA